MRQYKEEYNLCFFYFAPIKLHFCSFLSCQDVDQCAALRITQAGVSEMFAPTPSWCRTHSFQGKKRWYNLRRWGSARGCSLLKIQSQQAKKKSWSVSCNVAFCLIFYQCGVIFVWIPSQNGSWQPPWFSDYKAWFVRLNINCWSVCLTRYEVKQGGCGFKHADRLGPFCRELMDFPQVLQLPPTGQIHAG